jgi:hypothetical protein
MKEFPDTKRRFAIIMVMELEYGVKKPKKLRKMRVSPTTGKKSTKSIICRSIILSP